MTERPILFSGEMVRAILADQKTQTRRVVNPQPPGECRIHYMLGHERWVTPVHGTPLRHTWEAWHGPLYQNRPAKYLCGVHTVRCPYGAPGDRLWVRETWRGVSCIHYRADGAIVHGGRMGGEPTDPRVVSTWEPTPEDLEGFRWLPSIHMPRWASRITLEITDVRVQRLKDISYDDVLAEGCPLPGPLASPADFDWYRALWDSLNKARGYGWNVNPWVWAITFRRVGV